MVFLAIVPSMDFDKYTATENDHQRRLDRIIRKFLPEMPLSLVYKNIRSGFIRVNGTKAKNDTKISCGDEIWICTVLKSSTQKNQLNESNSNELQNLPNIEIQDVFVNRHIRIINKPYGINVQVAKQGEIALDPIIKQEFYKKHPQNSLSFKPGPLHRLDKNTTGLLAFSQSLDGSRWFTKAIENHQIKKTYIGIVEGNIKNTILLNDKICDSSENKNFHTVKVSETFGKIANTKIIPISTGFYKQTPVTLCFFEIGTGRKHQIRVQSSNYGYPLLGDTAYKSKISILKQENRHYFLHAYSLSFEKENPLDLPQRIFALPDSNFLNFVLKCALQMPDT